MTKVKICGITNLEDALLSAKFGAFALGFNFYKNSPRYIAPQNARQIIEQLPTDILKVGVFVNESLEKIAEIARIAKLGALQLHGEETPEFARQLKARTGLEIIKALRVSPAFKPEDVLQYETDAILLDAYSRKEHGGTGETFDWEIAKKVQAICPKMYLAGGLSADNIVKAISESETFAVDACSCLEERKGKKNRTNLINFITKVNHYHCWKKNSTIDGFEFKDIYDLLNLVHIRPGLYLDHKSLTALSGFLSGLKFADQIQKGGDGELFRIPPEFGYFLQVRFGSLPFSRILLDCGNDEEKAFDLFFAHLEEFKLEKKDLAGN